MQFQANSALKIALEGTPFCGRLMPFRNTHNQLARSVDSQFQTYRSKDGQKIAGQTRFQANSARKMAPEGTPFAEG